MIKSLFRIVEKAHIGILLGWTSCDNIGFYCFECGKDIEQKNGLQRHNIRFQTLKVENKVDLHWLCQEMSNRKHIETAWQTSALWKSH